DCASGGLLTVNVFAAGSGHGCHSGMPMGGRGDQDGVNVRAVQHFAKVHVGSTGFVVSLAVNLGIMIVDALAGPVSALTPDVATRHDLNLFSPSVAAGNVRPGTS